MVDLFSLFNDLEGSGFYDFVLPFLLVFTIIFAILEKTRIFGTDEGRPRTNINVVLAIIIGLIVVIQTNVVWVINLYLSKMALVIIIAIVFMLLIGIFGAQPEQGFSGGLFVLVFIGAILAAIWALTPTLGLELPFWLVPGYWDLTFIFVLIAVIVVIAIVLRRPGGGKGLGGVIEDIGRSIRGER